MTLAVRRMAAGDQIAADLARSTGNEAISVRPLELSDQGSVARFVDGWTGPLHILVNNAGVMANPQLERTAEGWEMQFATNFMGHFALALGLHGALAAAQGARIVSVSSSGNLFSPVVFDDLHFDFRPYDPLVAYGQSKTADALLAVEATRRWSNEGIYANALNPGAIATNLQRHTGGLKTPPRPTCSRTPRTATDRGGKSGRGARLVLRRGGPRGPGDTGHGVAQACPAGDTQLREDPVQVGAHRARRQSQPGRDLLVGQPPGGQVGDRQLLRGQRRGLRAVPEHALPGGLQLDSRLLGPRRRPQPLEGRRRRGERRPRRPGRAPSCGPCCRSTRCIWSGRTVTGAAAPS